MITQDETDHKWEWRCSTGEMVTPAAPWWCPLGPTTTRVKGPGQGKVRIDKLNPNP